MTRIASAQHQAEADMMSAAEQTMSAVPLVQAFGRENHEDQRFRNLTENVITCNMRVLVTQLQYKLVVGFTTAVGTAVVMAVGGLYVLNGALSLGSLIIFLSYLVALYGPMETLAHLSSTYADSTARAQRVAEILDSETSPEEPAEPKKLRPLNRKTGRSVSFDDVTFGYAPEHPVIRDLSLDIGSGQTVALVGATGVGKTTLVSLIPRFFDPWSGRVLIDGVDVRSLRLRELRSNIAMVLQEPFLFPVTIAENIAYGRPDCSQQEIKDMALAANADEFIQNLPLGYETRIGERGVTLSGGQRQRIAIARALLYDAPILILDEPTAALDVENEALILEALDRLMAGRTTIIIAHRLSTIRKADFVVRLNDGRASIENNRDVIFSGHRSGGDFALGQSKL
jgi:ATP-binding cassette subfamily B protein/subfamily B ATP-binding cassette protein MsbA